MSKKKRRKNPKPKMDIMGVLAQRRAEGKPSPLFNGDWDATERHFKMAGAIHRILSATLDLAMLTQDEQNQKRIRKLLNLNAKEDNGIDC